MSAAPFDAAAPHYAEDLAAQGVIFDRFRAVIREAMGRWLPRGSWVLDLGCGTGVDSLYLASQGHPVVAVDPSAGMLRALEAAAREAGLDHRIRVVRASAGALVASLPAELPPLGGAVSSFGPLNCEEDLGTVAAQLARLLPPGAPFICSPMARLCPWEIGAWMIRGRPGRALARLRRGPVAAPVSEAAPGVVIPTWYPSAAATRRAFSPWFRLVWQRGLGIFLPPPYLAGPRRHPRLLSALGDADDALGHRWPWRELGDHTLFVWVRR